MRLNYSLFPRPVYQIEDIGMTRIFITPEQQKLIEQLSSISSNGMDAFTTYQYLIRAREKINKAIIKEQVPLT